MDFLYETYSNKCITKTIDKKFSLVFFQSQIFLFGECEHCFVTQEQSREPKNRCSLFWKLWSLCMKQ